MLFYWEYAIKTHIFITHERGAVSQTVGVMQILKNIQELVLLFMIFLRVCVCVCMIVQLER